MTPLTVNPTVTLLVNELGSVLGIATNVAPINELTINVTKSPAEFQELSLGKPFVKSPDFKKFPKYGIA